MVLGVNLWSQQKNKEQLSFIMLPKNPKIRANGASDKNWSRSRVQVQLSSSVWDRKYRMITEQKQKSI